MGFGLGFFFSFHPVLRGFGRSVLWPCQPGEPLASCLLATGCLLV